MEYYVWHAIEKDTNCFYLWLQVQVGGQDQGVFKDLHMDNVRKTHTKFWSHLDAVVEAEGYYFVDER